MVENYPPPMNFEDAINAFEKFKEDHERGETPTWQFEDISGAELSIAERLSPEGIQAQKEMNGSNFTRELFIAIFQLGIEQGHRCYQHRDLKFKINEFAASVTSDICRM